MSKVYSTKTPKVEVFNTPIILNLNKMRECDEYYLKVKNIQIQLRLNSYFGAELVDKKRFIQKYSEEIYNTLIDAVVTKGNLTLEIRQSTNRDLVRDIIKLTDKIDYVTFHFIVNSDRTNNKTKISINRKHTDEKGESLVIVKVINPKEYMVKTDTVVRFYKEDFKFLKDLTKMFEVYDLKKLDLE